MRLHSYIVEHDCGFAPNPFFGICTLTACKPKIRKYAKTGDYVMGTGAKKRSLQGRLVYLMRIGSILTFDEYWCDKTFARKKPIINGSRIQMYGDNIYHRDPDGAWIQENSFHSKADGSTDPDNLRLDTATTDRVLIADWYCYFGGEGPVIPAGLTFAIQTTQGHRSNFSETQVKEVVAWVQGLGRIGPVGQPKEWQYSRLIKRGVR